MIKKEQISRLVWWSCSDLYRTWSQNLQANAEKQLSRIGFYSNAVQNPLQEMLSSEINRQSGCAGYELFMCSSGAEANENALKLASFHTGKPRVIAFQNAFHGRTSAAVAATVTTKTYKHLSTPNSRLFYPLQ